MLSTADGSDLLWQRLRCRSSVRSAATSTFSLSSIPADLGFETVGMTDSCRLNRVSRSFIATFRSCQSLPKSFFFKVIIVFTLRLFPTAFRSLIDFYKPHCLKSAHSADLQSIDFQAWIHFKLNVFSTFWSFFMNEQEAHVYIIHGAFGQLPFVSMEMVVSQGPLRRIAR